MRPPPPSSLPATSRAPVPIVTVYIVAAVSALDGWQLVNVPSVFHSQPPWQVTAGLMVIAAEVMVAFIRSEKVIAIADCVATPVAALAGTVPATVGAVVVGRGRGREHEAGQAGERVARLILARDRHRVGRRGQRAGR